MPIVVWNLICQWKHKMPTGVIKVPFFYCVNKNILHCKFHNFCWQLALCKDSFARTNTKNCVALHLNEVNLNFIHLRMLCAKFGWIWSAQQILTPLPKNSFVPWLLEIGPAFLENTTKMYRFTMTTDKENFWSEK